ncbi:DNA-binding response OmpR family regulator [Arthrobacter silviterrae]|uniref:Response regulator transcription factor n=1 Tax=Arthrobacter silviterrae TaxID=2026658 RepID=A0ABX0D9B6_9MICC|nr:response regulator transcription factor [Arthrobacter silviterrae]MDQ0279316.1 DNA-binding response OmpR family regulator [Arthrobacter silviterrae]NGN83482.1 response regulator transcription factor [Arthrobacter silviterrae]
MDSPRGAVVIEDDQDIRELINVVLNQSGFDVHAVDSGVDGVEAVRRHNPAVVTLDLGLPDIDGFEVARRIRLFSDCYIIMLTARGDELDTLLGLETGADDYLTKPFRPRELRARVGAMLRRPRVGAGGSAGSAGSTAEDFDRLNQRGSGASGDVDSATHRVPPSSGDVDSATRRVPPSDVEGKGDRPGSLGHSGLVLDGAARTAELDGAELELTRTEFDLLAAMLESGSLVRTKAELVRRLRGDGYHGGAYVNDSDERTIEVHMANLRRKLGDDPRSPRWIKTVRGVGYKLVV